MLCRIPRCHSPGDDDILGHSQNVWLDKQQERCNAVVVAAECGTSDGLTSGGSWQCFFCSLGNKRSSHEWGEKS